MQNDSEINCENESIEENSTQSSNTSVDTSQATLNSSQSTIVSSQEEEIYVNINLRHLNVNINVGTQTLVDNAYNTFNDEHIQQLDLIAIVERMVMGVLERERITRARQAPISAWDNALNLVSIISDYCVKFVSVFIILYVVYLIRLG